MAVTGAIVFRLLILKDLHLHFIEQLAQAKRQGAGASIRARTFLGMGGRRPCHIQMARVTQY
jgi:hypothetical protein